MTSQKTRELGTIWDAARGDDLSEVDLGSPVQLASAHRRYRGAYLGRSWYLLGPKGMLSWEHTGDGALEDCREYLRTAGYKPDEFEDEWARG
jgi:hypothetical protein